CLQPVLEPAPREMEADRAEHDKHYHARSGEEAVALDRIRRSLPAVVRDKPDEHRPHDPARRVPEEEAPPRHAPEPGHPGRRETQDRDEATEEHRLSPMALHDSLRP